MSKKTTIIIILILVLAILIGGGVLVWKNKQKVAQEEQIQAEQQVNDKQQEQGNLNENQTINNKISNREDGIAGAINNSSFKNDIKNIFNGDIKFDKKRGNVNYYENNFILSSEPLFNLSIQSYKYIKGASFIVEYEGKDFTVNLDDQIKAFDSVNNGDNEVKAMGSLGDVIVNAKLKKIGNNNFVIYDDFFKPSNSWSRYYLTYNKKNQQIIFVTFSFTYYDASDPQVKFEYSSDGKYFKNVTYPDEVSTYLKVVEENIESM